MVAPSILASDSADRDAASGQMDTVTNFIHREEKRKATFLRLHTPKGPLELSPIHLVFVRNGASTESMLASDVRIGTTLLHRDGEATVTCGRASVACADAGR